MRTFHILARMAPRRLVSGLAACAVALAASACAVPPEGDPRQGREAGQAAAAELAAQRRAADDTLERLSLAVERARAAIRAVEAAPPTPAAQNTVSDTRRTIVVANVALQKAREAISRGDYGGASATCEAATERLEAAIRTLSATSASVPDRRRD